MNNAQIILNESIQLLNEGIIKSTGRFITIENADGTKETLPEPEPIHTFNGWKTYGRQIKKGSHAVAAFPIWKYTEKKTETAEASDAETEPETITNMFLKTSFFFTYEQTEPVKVKEA